jgi:hypothetical protein
MNVAIMRKIRELRILWVSRLDSSLGMAWVEDKSHLVDRVWVEGGCDGQ